MQLKQMSSAFISTDSFQRLVFWIESNNGHIPITTFMSCFD